MLEKINNKKAVVGVVGLGYVGLPLAVEKAKAGYKTIGFDMQEKKVDMVNKGISYISDVSPDDLLHVVGRGLLKATCDIGFIRNIDCVAICVPTPLDKYRQPDISHVVSSVKDIAESLHPGMLIVLESTTYPGMTKEVVKPLLENTGLKCGEDFFLAFSPERIDPGNRLYKTRNIPKVVGGVTKKCTEVAASLYRNILDEEVIEVSSPSVAEMEKILENAYRIVNIGFINEMAVICHKMGINIWEVIDAAKSKPYGFTAFYPGAGAGGHCIPIDPFYLSWKAREYDCRTRFIEMAGEINSYMPDYVVERAIRMLNRSGIALKGASILMLGVAYKQDIDDFRESPALSVLEKLEGYGASVSYNDPYIPWFEYKGKVYKGKELSSQNLKEADMVIITTSHSPYDYDFIRKNSKNVFDTKNAMRSVKNRENIELL